MSDHSLQLLKERRAAIAAELRGYAAKIDILKTEDADLENAERVLARLLGEAATEPASSVTAPAPGSGKPAGTPTTPQMILSLVKEAKQQGKRGLEPREMQISIARRWWPSVKSEDVAPTAWRMWKDGRLQKDGPLYMLPENTEAADLPLGGESAASEVKPEAKGREAGPGGGP